MQSPTKSPAFTLREASDTQATERSVLVAGVAFIEGVATGWGCWELSGWFEEHLVSTGRIHNIPPVVTEEGFGFISIDARRSGGIAHRDQAAAALAQLPKLLATARARVVDALRAFLPPRCDDRFLRAALYAGRVERKPVGHDVAWLSTPRETDRLSDVVLSLFAADALTHREFHEANLCVCEACGRVSFDPAAVPRTGCRVHARGQSGGFPASS